MQTVLLVLHLLIALALIGVVLMQRSEGGALGIGGGGGAGSLFSARGVGNTLTRTTAILAIIFFLTSIGLTLLSVHRGGGSLFAPTGGGTTEQAPAGGDAAPELPGQNQTQQEQGAPKVPVSQ
ncbi:MAG: preprotein translocase subunit SecG [Parvibaculaceae bacterium]|jgi:preprotein translocase subunit SecG